MSRWRWGALHRAEFRHPLAAEFNLPAVPRGGDGNTVNATGFATDFRQITGASYRQIFDVGQWDNSVGINVPGQSGRPGSPHYGDLLAMWAAGEYFPLAYSREAVERYAASRLLLEPAAGARK
jgi:penicillin amidase